MTSSDQLAAPGTVTVHPRPTDGLAVAALVTSLVGGSLVSIVLGVLALRRTARSGAGGRGLAVAGVVLGAVQVVAGLAIAVATVLLGVGISLSAGSSGSAGSAGSAQDGATARTPADGGGTGADGADGGVGSALAIDTLLAGDCFDESASSMDTGSVSLADCAVPHTAEVVQVHPLDAVFGDDYPGRQALADEAEEHCSQAVGQAVAGSGLDGEGLEYTYYYPTEANWQAGSRLVQCNLTSASGLVGSLTAGTLSAW
ncbi:septum formation family protein [Kineococcus sp. SYSU DK006]|uniref:DUF4190 domain-containing protein n=1 Tax=Kineococcus sp. SYSU DK006 TaxID=3383127 RepID=UPI003D7E9F58